MSAAEALVGGAEGRGDLPHDVDVVIADDGAADAGTEHASGGLVVVQERHGNAGCGEGGNREEAPAFDIGAAEVGDGGDRIDVDRPLGVRWSKTDVDMGDHAAQTT